MSSAAITTSSPPKRMTRARAAARTKREASSEREVNLSEEPTTTALPKTKSATKRSKVAAPPSDFDLIEEPNDELEPEMEPPRRPTRKTATAAPMTTLNAPPRRKVRVTPLNQNQTKIEDILEPEPAPMAETTSSTTTKAKTSNSTRGRGKKIASAPATAEDAATEQVKDGVPWKPKTKGKNATTAQVPAPDAEATPPKTRSRAKKTTKTTITNTEAPASTSNPSDINSEKHKPGGRTRAGSGATATVTRSTAASAARAATTKGTAVPPKKKVTFQEPSDRDSDKENIPLPLPAKQQKGKTTAGRKDPNPKPAQVSSARGTRGRSTRKPASAMTTNEDAKKKTGEKEKRETVSVSQPLSPKKITQIAKSSSSSSLDSEEDELSGGKTPLRVPAQSPIRPPIGQGGSPIKKLDFSSTTALPRSPEKQQQQVSTVMLNLSPPRRPPPSPFKDAMKESPKRPAEVPFVLPQSAQRISKPTLIVKASQKFQPQSTLQQSPAKRGNIDGSSMFQNSTFKPSKSPMKMKASLLQSPARRLFTPAKTPTVNASPKKAADVGMQTPSRFTLSQAHASALRSEETANTILADDLCVDQPVDVDFDESILNVRSPVRVSPKKGVEAQPSTIAEEQEEAVLIIDNDLPMAEHIPEEPIDIENQQENDEIAMTPGEDPFTTLEPSRLRSVPPVVEAIDTYTPRGAVTMTEHLFRSAAMTTFSDEDEESEDELQANITPAKRFIASGRTPRTLNSISSQAGFSPVKPGQQAQSLGFTPLAVQFGNWLAASPDRPVPRRGRRGVFSPVKLGGQTQTSAEGVDAVTEGSVPAATASPEKASRRKSVAAGRKSLVGGRKSVTTGSRMSIGDTSAAETSRQATGTFFEDEMAVRELEEDVENLETETQPEEAAIIFEETDGDVLQDAGESEEPEMEEETAVAEDAVEQFSEVSFEGEDGYQDVLEPERMEAASDVDMEVNDGSDVNTGLPVEVEVSEEMRELEKHQPALETQEVDDPAASENEAESVHNHYESNGPTESSRQDQEVIALTVQGVAEQEPMLQENESPSLPSTANPPETSPLEVDDANMEPTTSRAPLADLAIAAQTPTHPTISLSRFHNTVISKVPLRQEGHVDSPLKVPRKRSRSLSADPRSRSPRKSAVAFSPVKGIRPLAPTTTTTTSPLKAIDQTSSTSPSDSRKPERAENFNSNDDADSIFDIDTENLPPPPNTPGAATTTASTQPNSDATLTSARKRSPTKSASSVLSGAVIFVDVFTSEGADASGIFIDLLTQMGARCMKSWSWNPRQSILNPEGDDMPNGSKIGITHVIYKDGGKRTLEKVRDAKEVVKCVGVGWVLDCEKEGKWLDETPYNVDVSIFPRGGSRRRKSMEPRALVNQGGSLFASHMPRKSLGNLGLAVGRRSISADLTPAKKRLGLDDSEDAHAASSPITSMTTTTDMSTAAMTTAATEIEFSPGVDNSSNSLDIDVGSPVSSGFSTPTGVQNAAFAAQHPLPETPTGHVSYDPSADADSPDMDMETPYLMREGGKLVQMSCPPKQTQQGLFGSKPPTTADREEGEGDMDQQVRMTVRRRLELAGRRRTLGVVGQGKGKGKGKGSDPGLREEGTWTPSPLGKEAEVENE